MKYLLLISLFTGQLLASETDTFTARHWDFLDLTNDLNHEVRSRMDQALRVTNELPGCNSARLKTKLGKNLRRHFIGLVEAWINASDLPVYQIKREDSIYKDATISESIGLVITKASLGTNLKINQEIIGSDKIGHFFDQGWSLYELYQETGDLYVGFDFSDEAESGIYGLTTTGVISYADKVANFQGLKFWSDIVSDGYETGKRPYFICQNNRFIWNREFDWADYVDSSWDETNNCNEFRQGGFDQKIQANIKAMGMKCPMEPEKCIEASLNYGPLKDHLLHPKCRF